MHSIAKALVLVLGWLIALLLVLATVDHIAANEGAVMLRDWANLGLCFVLVSVIFVVAATDGDEHPLFRSKGE